MARRQIGEADPPCDRTRRGVAEAQHANRGPRQFRSGDDPLRLEPVVGVRIHDPGPRNGEYPAITPVPAGIGDDRGASGGRVGQERLEAHPDHRRELPSCDRLRGLDRTVFRREARRPPPCLQIGQPTRGVLPGLDGVGPPQGLFRQVEISPGEVDLEHDQPRRRDVGVELGGAAEPLERRIRVAQATLNVGQLDVEEPAVRGGCDHPFVRRPGLSVAPRCTRRPRPARPGP